METIPIIMIQQLTSQDMQPVLPIANPDSNRFTYYPNPAIAKLIAKLKETTMSIADSEIKNTMSLLDASLDDMNDMPEWKNFPAGAYTVKPSVKMETKKNPKTNANETHITVGAKLIAVKELADPNSVAPEVGSETQVRYTWENEYGQGGLKNLLKPIAAATQLTKVPELLEAIDTADSVVLVMGIRKGKVEAGKETPEYQTFTDLIVE